MDRALQIDFAAVAQKWHLTYAKRQAGLEVALESDAARTQAVIRHRAVVARGRRPRPKGRPPTRSGGASKSI